MRIQIDQTHKEDKYGKLYKTATIDAASKLSGEAFKEYVKLHLNMHGFHWVGDLPSDVVRELTDKGYLRSQGNEIVLYNVPSETVRAITPPIQAPQPKYEPPIYTPPVTAPAENEVSDYESEVVNEYIRRGYMSSYDMAGVLRLTPDGDTLDKISDIWKANQQCIMDGWTDNQRQSYELMTRNDNELPW